MIFTKRDVPVWNLIFYVFFKKNDENQLHYSRVRCGEGGGEEGDFDWTFQYPFCVCGLSICLSVCQSVITNEITFFAHFFDFTNKCFFTFTFPSGFLSIMKNEKNPEFSLFVRFYENSFFTLFVEIIYPPKGLFKAENRRWSNCFYLWFIWVRKLISKTQHQYFQYYGIFRYWW